MGFSDDVIYGGLLVFSVIFGYVLKEICGSKRKQYISSGIGVVVLLLVCRAHSFHSLFTATINALIIRLCPRYGEFI